MDLKELIRQLQGWKSPPEGHPFYGNQWTEGAGGGGGEGTVSSYRGATTQDQAALAVSQRLAQAKAGDGSPEGTWLAQGTTRGETKDDMLQAIVQEQGFDGLPRVGNTAELDALIQAGGTELWRGINFTQWDAEQLNSTPRELVQQFTEQFRSGEYYIGQGINGNGTYTSTQRDEAETYAISSLNQEGLLRMVLTPEARTCTYNDFTAAIKREEMVAKETHEREFAQAWNLYEQGDKEGAMSALRAMEERERLNNDWQKFYRNDCGRWAAANGYDAVQVHNNHYLILNRTALLVEEAH